MRVLVVSAHPDDETMFAGGKLAQLAAMGHDVVILCTTRGEGGEVGDPPLTTKDLLGQVREQEMRCAGAALGASEVRFLDYVDPHMEIGGTPLQVEATLEEFAAAIRGHLAELRPEMVMTHGSSGEYGHPQHVFTHQATFAAISGLDGSRPREVLTWMARRPDVEEDRLTNRDDPADEVLDVTPWLEAKLSAALCHRTQHTMFIRNNEGARGVRDILRPIESFRQWPIQ
jgi:N-acetylglucosamine malate deacetylase 2